MLALPGNHYHESATNCESHSRTSRSPNHFISRCISSPGSWPRQVIESLRQTLDLHGVNEFYYAATNRWQQQVNFHFPEGTAALDRETSFVANATSVLQNRCQPGSLPLAKAVRSLVERSKRGTDITYDSTTLNPDRAFFFAGTALSILEICMASEYCKDIRESAAGPLFSIYGPQHAQQQQQQQQQGS